MATKLTEQNKAAAVSQAVELMSFAAKLLFENGQTTRRMVEAVTQMGDTLGLRATLIPHWGELTLRVDDVKSSRYASFAAEPAGVDMHRVAAVMQLVDDFNAGKIGIDKAQSALEKIGRFPPASTLRILGAGKGSHFGSDSHLMILSGELAVLQRGNQRHASRYSNLVACAERVGYRERK